MCDLKWQNKCDIHGYPWIMCPYPFISVPVHHRYRYRWIWIWMTKKVSTGYPCQTLGGIQVAGRNLVEILSWWELTQILLQLGMIPPNSLRSGQIEILPESTQIPHRIKHKLHGHVIYDKYKIVVALRRIEPQAQGGPVWFLEGERGWV